MKKKIIILIISILLISLITFIAGYLKVIDDKLLRIVINILLNLLNGGVAIVAMKLTGMKVDLDIKNYKQYIIGLIIGILLSIFFVMIPTLLGFNMVGGHANFSITSIIFYLFYFILVIGPVEELIFRVYLQDTFTSFFKKNKYIGVIITAFIFGMWHFINGSFISVIFTFIIGLIFGLSKYYIKDCKYLGLSLGHGLYDFLNIIYRMFIV